LQVVIFCSIFALSNRNKMKLQNGYCEDTSP
jgi:hypothetical protein